MGELSWWHLIFVVTVVAVVGLVVAALIRAGGRDSEDPRVRRRRAEDWSASLLGVMTLLTGLQIVGSADASSPSDAIGTPIMFVVLNPVWIVAMWFAVYRTGWRGGVIAAWAASLPVAAIVANVAAYHLHPAVGVVIGVVVMVGVWATVLSNPARTAAEDHVADR
ncbi:hypothetical protein [Gordonia shandongensis]|uniref:hypothetical protein n=1 Tax=Gordonia shandongensis TaxID=376351 RepID=UPI000410963A|nr:hypothetical protein [Gordonia shandongensis]